MVPVGFALGVHGSLVLMGVALRRSVIFHKHNFVKINILQAPGAWIRLVMMNRLELGILYCIVFNKD